MTKSRMATDAVMFLQSLLVSFDGEGLDEIESLEVVLVSVQW